jgi:hypothetical protein
MPLSGRLIHYGRTKPVAATPPKAKRNRKAKPKTTNPGTAQAKSNGGIDESALTKGEIRKLNALRKSVGDKLAEDTFAKWLNKRQSAQTGVEEDKNAALIADELIKLIEEKNVRIPRGGYLVTRGRGRVIVSSAASA